MVASIPPGVTPRPRGRPKKKKTRPPKIAGLTTREGTNGAIRTLRELGYSAADIAHAAGISERTVRRGGLVDHPSSSRQGTVSAAVKARRKRVKAIHKKKPRSTSSDIANELAKEGIVVSRDTIVRDLKALGARRK